MPNEPNIVIVTDSPPITVLVDNPAPYEILQVGVQGPIGPAGSSGTSGADGSSGTSGKDGTFLGSSGTSGTAGSTGSSGSTGTSGHTGSSGTSGTSLPGSAGSSGSSGTGGSSGTSGQNGSSGTSGLTGSSGTSGTAGTVGSSGTTGSSGTSATSGSSGTAGSSGTSGSTGSSGTAGSTGSSGTAGTSGQNGLSLGQILYPHNDPAQPPTASGYTALLTTEPNGPEVLYTVLTSTTIGEKQFSSGSAAALISASFITNVNYPNVTLIPNGEWEFDTWGQVDSVTGTTQIVARVYKSGSGTGEVELFNASSSALTPAATPVQVIIDTLQGDFAVLSTDRIVVKYSAKSTSGPTRTVNLFGEGTTHYTHIHSTLGAVSGTSGTSGQNGSSGTSGQNGSSGTSGIGSSGTSGQTGSSGTAGTSGQTPAAGGSVSNATLKKLFVL